MPKPSPAEEDTGLNDMVKEELVRFDNVKACYYIDAPRLTLTYTLVYNQPFTPHDWIGLFPLHWRDTLHPLASISAAPKTKSKKKKKRTNHEDRRQVDFPLRDSSITTSDQNQRYQFVYVSKSGVVYGKSREFSIQGEELWNLEGDDDEFSRLSSLQSSPTTVIHDSEISILSRSHAASTGAPATESPVLLSYPSDMESEGGDPIHEEWDITNGTEEKGEKVVSETVLSEFSDIEILSTSPSKDDTGKYVISSDTSPIRVYPEDDFTLGDIKVKTDQIVRDEMNDAIEEHGEKDDTEKSFTRMSKKSKKQKKKSESYGNASVTGGMLKSDSIGVKGGHSQTSYTSNNKKSKMEKTIGNISDQSEDFNVSNEKLRETKSRKSEKCLPQFESVVNTVWNGIALGGFDEAEYTDDSQKSSKRGSKKYKTKRSKTEPIESDHIHRAPEDGTENTTDVKDEKAENRYSKQSKKKTKSKQTEVIVEKFPTPPNCHQVISESIAEIFRFVDVEDDVISIDGISTTTEGRETEDKELVWLDSKKEKRNKKNKRANNKRLIVELGSEENKENLDRKLIDTDEESLSAVSAHTDKPVSDNKASKDKRHKKGDNGRTMTQAENNEMLTYSKTPELKNTTLETKFTPRNERKVLTTQDVSKTEQNQIATTDNNAIQSKSNKKSKRSCKSKTDDDTSQSEKDLKLEKNKVHNKSIQMEIVHIGDEDEQDDKVLHQQNLKQTKRSKKVKQSTKSKHQGHTQPMEKTKVETCINTQPHKTIGLNSNDVVSCAGTSEDKQSENGINYTDAKLGKRSKRSKKCGSNENVPPKTQTESSEKQNTKDDCVRKTTIDAEITTPVDISPLKKENDQHITARSSNNKGIKKEKKKEKITFFASVKVQNEKDEQKTTTCVIRNDEKEANFQAGTKDVLNTFVDEKDIKNEEAIHKHRVKVTNDKKKDNKNGCLSQFDAYPDVKKVTFVSCKENLETKEHYLNKKCSSDEKIRTCLQNHEEIESATYRKLDSKQVIRDKIYLEKREKIKETFNNLKKECRTKSKTKKVIVLKDMFQEPIISNFSAQNQTAKSQISTGEELSKIPAVPSTAGIMSCCSSAKNKPTRMSRLCSSQTLPIATPAWDSSSSRAPRPQIPAYLLDVMDDLPDDPNNHLDFRQWRKAMARGKGKRQQQHDQPATDPAKATTERVDNGEEGKQKAYKIFDKASAVLSRKDAISNGIKVTSRALSKITETVGGGEDDDGNRDKLNAPRKNTQDVIPSIPLMSYAGVLKGLSEFPGQSENAERGESSGITIQPPRKTKKSSTLASKHRAQQLADKKVLIQARRAIFSSGYNAADETQCYLLDKVEDKLVGKHPKYSMRAKLRTANKLKMGKTKRKKLMQLRVKNRIQKEIRNGEMFSSCTLVPKDISLAGMATSSVPKNIGMETDATSIVWPLPSILSVVSYGQNNKALLKEINDVYPDKEGRALVENVSQEKNATLEYGVDQWRDMEDTLDGSGTLYTLQDVVDSTPDATDDMDILHRVELCWPSTLAATQDSFVGNAPPTSSGIESKIKNKNLRLSGIQKPPVMSRVVVQKLRSELKVKERAVASLENQLNHLKEIQQKQMKVDIKARLMYAAIKKKYLALKVSCNDHRRADLEPERSRSNDDVTDIEEVPCKKRRLEATGMHNDEMQESVDTSQSQPTSRTNNPTFPLDLRKENDPSIDTSGGLYPDIQKELRNLQDEVDKFSFSSKYQMTLRQHQGLHQKQENFSFKPSVSVLQNNKDATSHNPVNPLGNPIYFSAKCPNHLPHQSNVSSETKDMQAKRKPECAQPQYFMKPQSVHIPCDQQQPQLHIPPLINVPNVTVNPYPSQRNAAPCQPTQYSPPRPALLPTPQLSQTFFQPEIQPPHPSPNSVSTCHQNFSNHLENGSTYPPPPPPPYHRSGSPTASHYSPARQKERLQSVHRTGTFGSHRYNPMLRNNPQPVPVPLRERHSNRPTPCPCYGCSCTFPCEAPVYRRPHNTSPDDEFYSSENSENCQYGRVYVFPENPTVCLRLPTPYHGVINPESITMRGNPINNNNPYPNACCMPRHHECNCCQNFNLPYQA